MDQLERVNAALKAGPKMRNGFTVTGPGINGFADITWEEYKEMFHLNQKFVFPNITPSANIAHYKYKGLTVPVNVNLIESGIVLPARSQGSCGSCWSFSAAASLEGLQAKQSGKAVYLSPSNILECSGASTNCDAGADPFQGMDYAATLGGLDAEECYPYTYETATTDQAYKACAESSSCRVKINFVDPQTYVMQNADSNANALAMKEVASVQPISVSINFIDALGSYDGTSIFYADASTCDPTSTNHAINVVGYGTSSGGQDYWIVKNSHGTGWGKEGFGAIARGVNVCGIESHSSFPNGGLI